MCDCKDEAVLAGKGASSEETRHLRSQSDFQGEGEISKAEEKRKDNKQRSKAVCQSAVCQSALLTQQSASLLSMTEPELMAKAVNKLKEATFINSSLSVK